MRQRHLLGCCLACVLIAPAGCSESEQAVIAVSPEHLAPSARELNHIYMVDNAILRDASICDLHFVPHTAELSGLGVQRLTRMAELFSVCGGTVCYETSKGDEQLIEPRLACVRAFLAAAGTGGRSVDVVTSLPRGRGISATEAIAIRAKGTTQSTASAGSERSGGGKSR